MKKKNILKNAKRGGFEMINPAEKIKEIEKEAKRLSKIKKPSKSDIEYHGRLLTKLQVYKEWEESLSNTNHTNHTNDIEQKLTEYWQEMGRQQREAEILEIIDKWFDNLMYCRITLDDVKELKSKIKGEDLK